MKKFLALILAALMILPVNIMAEEEKADDVFNNPIFEIVATLKDEPSNPSSDAVLIKKQVYNGDYISETDEYAFEEMCYYSDGSYTVKPLLTAKAYRIDKATKYFPKGLETYEGFYLLYEDSGEKIGDNYYQNIYLVDTNKEEITKTLVGAYAYSYDVYTSTSYDYLYGVDENGVINDKEPILDGVTNIEYTKFMNGTEYEDGLKFGKVGEGFLNTFTDINDKVYFADPVATYYGYFYNLGYLVEVSNNGGTLDYSLEDPESQRVYWSSIKNVFTGEICGFEDVDIREIFDSGYLLLDVKDENRVETTYIAKLKKNAVIKVMLNGEKILFDVLPSITDGRTLVPLRAIFEALGAEVEWDSAAQKITAKKDDITVSMQIGNKTLTKNEETVELDVAPTIIDGRTLVPVRAVAEGFNVNVAWDDAAKTVSLSTK